MTDDDTGCQKPTDEPDVSPQRATVDADTGESVERGGLSMEQLQRFGSDAAVRVGRRPDGSKVLVEIDGVDDLVHTERDTGPDGEPLSLHLAVGYDARTAGVTLSPTMLEELIERLETHLDAFEEADRP